MTIVTFVTILVEKASIMLSQAIDYGQAHLGWIPHEIRILVEGLSAILIYEFFKIVYIRIKKNKKSTDEKKERLLTIDYVEGFVEQLEELQEQCQNEGKTKRQTLLILASEVIKFYENGIRQKIKSMFDGQENP